MLDTITLAPFLKEVHPIVSVTTKLMSKTPGMLKVWVAFCPGRVNPSPVFHTNVEVELD